MNKAQIGPDATCSTCCYYLEQEHGKGSCHRFPPRFAGEQAARDIHRWQFPLTSMHAWCGEHACPETPSSSDASR